jgi:putative endonuclease
MFYVYVLRSKRNGKRYIGYTSRDVQKRLYEHNRGDSKWTSGNGPFELIYADDFITVKEAKEVEKFLKSGQGRQCLDELEI